MKSPEELFCSGKVLYSGQPVGLIYANSTDLARQAAAKVRITYKNHSKPVLTIQEGMKIESRLIPARKLQLGEKPSGTFNAGFFSPHLRQIGQMDLPES